MNVVVVNDCGYVMEDLMEDLAKKFSVTFLRRSRGLYDKTIGLSKKIFMSNGDLYHVNYALQDAFIVSKLKSLDVLHCHGSDIRWVINSKKWGWLVKRNLSKAKVVLCSTPDLIYELEKYVEYPIWLPNPIQTATFKPSSNHHGALKAVYFEKWYEQLPSKIPKLCEKHKISLTIIPLGIHINHKHMPQFLNQFDIFIDRFKIRSWSKTCLEAMACGLAVVPVYEESLAETFSNYLNPDLLKQNSERNRDWILQHHDSAKVANQLASIWRKLD